MESHYVDVAPPHSADCVRPTRLYSTTTLFPFFFLISAFLSINEEPDRLLTSKSPDSQHNPGPSGFISSCKTY